MTLLVFVLVAAAYGGAQTIAIRRFLRGDGCDLDEPDQFGRRDRDAQRIWFRLDRSEHERLVRWHCESSRFFAHLAVVVGILVLALAVVYGEAPHTAVAMLGIAVMAAVVAGVFVVERVLTHRTFGSTTELVVDAWGVRCTNAGACWRRPWSALHRWTEAPDGVFVDFAGNRALYIPRRAFENDSRFGALLASFTGRLVAL